MSWLFSRALVEAYSEVNCSDGEPSVQSNGNPTQLAYLPPDRMTDFSRLSRFGMTFRLLTENRGKALLMSYLAGFHAKTSALQDEATDSKASGQECGNTWQGWLAKFDQDSCSWKTPQCLLFGGGQESLQTLPRSGMTQDGLLWEQTTLALRIRGTESGLWPTPTVNGNYNRKGASPTSGDGLATAVMTWRTPQAADAKSTKVQKGHQTNLTHQVMKWPTPTAHNAKETNAPSEAKRNEPTLARRVGGTLNPTWVEWLIGWPLEWTDLKPLAMDKFQQWQQQHLHYSLQGETDD